MAGEQNGTDIFLAVETSPSSGVYTIVGGQTVYNLTLNNNLIDITNKSSASFQTFLAGAGTQGLNVTLDLIFSSDAMQALVRISARDITALNYRINMPIGNLDFAALIATSGDSSPDGAALTSNVSLQSTGSFTFQ